MAKPKPGEAAPSERTLPLTARLNIVSFIVQIVVLVVVLSMYGMNGRWPKVDALEMRHCQNALLLLIPVLVVEMAFLLSAAFGIRVARADAPHARLTNVRMCFLTVVHYMVKLTTIYSIVYFGGSIVHVDDMALTGPRPVYTIRTLQWSMACPLMMIISNETLTGWKPLDLRRRDWPSLVNTIMYPWTSWVALVTHASHPVKWLMFLLAFGAFVTASADQVSLFREQGFLVERKLKGALVGYQIVNFLFYGVIFLFSRLGLIPASSEVIIYSYGDVSLKLIHSGMNTIIRSREDIHNMFHWWSTASAKFGDLERLIRTASVPIVSTTLTGEVLLWNKKLADLTGIPSEKAMGRPLPELVSEKSRDEVALAIQTRDPTALFVSIDKANALDEKADGESVHKVKLIFKFVVQHSTEDEEVGLTAIGQDLTETVLLRETEERHARLSGILSHELKSPLHGIIGISSVLAQTETHGTRKKQLAMVKSSATRLRDMVSDIMELTAQNEMERQGARMQLPVERLNILRVINEVVLMTRSSVNRANKPLLAEGVELVNMCPNVAPAIIGNEDKLLQLFYNLLANACKFTKKGSITVSTRLEDQYLLIDITDTGYGISADYLDKIFMPFEQDRSENTADSIGLGLSIARNIATAHEGRISVRSQVGAGSTFTVYLPALSENVEAESTHTGFKETSPKAGSRSAMELPAPCPPVPMLEPSPTPQTKSVKETECKLQPSKLELSLAAEKSKVHVLSVDDCEVNQIVVKCALETMCTVHTAMNGQEALDFMKHTKPDLVLLDLMMPVMDGFGTLLDMQESPELREVPVIMLSAAADWERLLIDSLDAGAVDFLFKPASADLLKAKVASRIFQTRTIKERAESEARLVAEKHVVQLQQSLKQQVTMAPAAPVSAAVESSMANIGPHQFAQSDKKSLLEPPFIFEPYKTPQKDMAMKTKTSTLKPASESAPLSTPKFADVATHLEDKRDDTPARQNFAEQECAQLRTELAIRDKYVYMLAKELAAAKTEAFLDHNRANSLQREVDWMTSRCGMQSANTTPRGPRAATPR
eukprot:TRINITY_DN63185_c0_g1_i1.p1 TRINITY_DN63185_c0_g1~~TRINITY_DN63185_c0_g1_i1.p1  ORF type:complete len:1093 (+),score=176.81 TRINITY_DN63185_c0_g1_i1:114-3281(+)